MAFLPYRRTTISTKVNRDNNQKNNMMFQQILMRIKVKSSTISLLDMHNLLHGTKCFRIKLLKQGQFYFLLDNSFRVVCRNIFIASFLRARFFQKKMIEFTVAFAKMLVTDHNPNTSLFNLFLLRIL